MSTILLPKYTRVKNNYCVGFFGCDEDLERLKNAKPSIEAKFPGLNLYIICNDEKANGKNNIYHKAFMQDVVTQVAYYRTIEDLDFFLEEVQIG